MDQMPNTHIPEGLVALPAPSLGPKFAALSDYYTPQELWDCFIAEGGLVESADGVNLSDVFGFEIAKDHVPIAMAFAVFLDEFERREFYVGALLSTGNCGEFFDLLLETYRGLQGDDSLRFTAVDRALGLSSGSCSRYKRGQRKPLRYNFYSMVQAMPFFGPQKSRLVADIPERFELKGIPGACQEAISGLVADMAPLEMAPDEKLETLLTAMRVRFGSEFRDIRSQLRGFLDHYHPDFMAEARGRTAAAKAERPFDELINLAKKAGVKPPKPIKSLKLLERLPINIGLTFQRLIGFVAMLGRPGEVVLPEVALTVERDESGNVKRTKDIADFVIGGREIIECKLGGQDPKSIVRQVERQLAAADKLVAQGSSIFTTNLPTATIVINDFDPYDSTFFRGGDPEDLFERILQESDKIELNEAQLDKAKHAVESLFTSVSNRQTASLERLRSVAAESVFADRISVVASVDFLNANSERLRKIEWMRGTVSTLFALEPYEPRTVKSLVDFFMSAYGCDKSRAKQITDNIYLSTYGKPSSAITGEYREACAAKADYLREANKDFLHGIAELAGSTTFITMRTMVQIIRLLYKRDVDRDLMEPLGRVFCTLSRVKSLEYISLQYNSINPSNLFQPVSFVIQKLDTLSTILFNATHDKDGGSANELNKLADELESFCDEKTRFLDEGAFVYPDVGDMQCHVEDDISGKLQITNRRFRSKGAISPKWLIAELKERGWDDIDALLEIPGADAFIEAIINSRIEGESDKRSAYEHYDDAIALLLDARRLPSTYKLKRLCKNMRRFSPNPDMSLSAVVDKPEDIAFACFGLKYNSIVATYGSNFLQSFWADRRAANLDARVMSRTLMGAIRHYFGYQTLGELIAGSALGKPKGGSYSVPELVAYLRDWTKRAYPLLTQSHGVDLKGFEDLREAVIDEEFTGNHPEMDSLYPHRKKLLSYNSKKNDLDVLAFLYSQHTMTPLRIHIGRVERLILEYEFLKTVDDDLAEACVAWHLNQLDDFSDDAEFISPQFNATVSSIERLAENPSIAGQTQPDPRIFVKADLASDEAPLSTVADPAKFDEWAITIPLILSNLWVTYIGRHLEKFSTARRLFTQVRAEIGNDLNDKNSLPLSFVLALFDRVRYERELAFSLGRTDVPLKIGIKPLPPDKDPITTPVGNVATALSEAIGNHNAQMWSGARDVITRHAGETLGACVAAVKRGHSIEAAFDQRLHTEPNPTSNAAPTIPEPVNPEKRNREKELERRRKRKKIARKSKKKNRRRR